MKKKTKKYQKGGKVTSDSTKWGRDWYLANKLQTNTNPELKAQRAEDSNYAAQQLQDNPAYVPAAVHMYTQFMDQNPKSPDIDMLRNKIDAYRAAYETFVKGSRGKAGKYYGGKLKKALDGIEMDGAEPSKLLDNPQGQTPTGVPVQQYNNLYGTAPIPGEVTQGFQQTQERNLPNDPVALNQARPNKGLPPVSPDVIDQYHPQPAEDKGKRKPRNTQGPTLSFNTGDIVAGIAQGINALIPQPIPKDNLNLLQMANNIQPQKEGSHGAFEFGGAIAKSGFKINPKHKGYCTPMTKSTCTGKRRTFALNAKAHFKKRKEDGGPLDEDIIPLQDEFAVDGTSIVPENWQALHAYAYQNDPQYGSASYNHGQFATPILEAFNKAYPNQAIQPNQVAGYQQYFQQQAQIDPQRINAPQGLSGTDNIYGPKTQTTNPRNYQLVQMKGDKVVSDQKFGPHPEQLLAANTPKPQPIAQVAPVSNQLPQQQKSAMDFSQGVSGDVYNPYAKKPRQQVKQQKSNYFTAGTPNYSVDSLRMQYGGVVPLKGSEGLQVDNNQYKHLSDDTIELGGNYHTDGGTMIRSAGNEVEAEKAETVTADPATGSLQVLGNLWMTGTKQKHKDVMKDIAKLEKKTDKKKGKSSFLMNNFDVKDQYQGPAAMTGYVLADAVAQEDQHNKMLKKAVIDDNNMQLQMAEHMGVEPKAISSKLRGKAKYGTRMKKYDMGGDPSDDGKGGIASQMMPEMAPALPPYGPVAPKKTTGVTKQLDQITGQVFNPIDPANYIQQQEPLRNQPGLPDSFRQDQVGINQIPTAADDAQQSPIPQPVGAPQPVAEGQLPASQDFKEPYDLRAQAPVKGMRNKFHVSDYLPEIMSGLDQVRPVQMPQARAILDTDYSVSFQDEKNAILSAYKPALASQANNPAVQAGIAAQMAQQLSSVDAKEEQFNEQNRARIREGNQQELRRIGDTNLKLDIQKQQYQDAAREAHDERVFGAARSISGKEAQRRAQNKYLQMEELGYGWVMGDDGKYHMIKPDHEFSPQTVYTQDPSKDYKKTYTKKSTPKGQEDTVKEEEQYYGGQMFSGGMMGGLAPMAGQMAARGTTGSYFPGGPKKKKCNKK